MSVHAHISFFCSLMFELRTLVDLNYFLPPLIVSTDASALGTEIDLDVVNALTSSSDGFHSLEGHRRCASGTSNVFFRL